MRRAPLITLLFPAVLLPALAIAHIGANDEPLTAGATEEITLAIGHGCEGADTSSVRTTLPPSVTTVRAMTSDFGRATVEKNGAGAPVAVSWVRDDANLLPVDTNFYKLTLRARLPNAPFTTLFFPTEQRCKLADGGVAVNLWTNTTGMASDAGEEEAPMVVLVPAHRPGWNKLTVPVAVTDLSLYFSNAQIVWRGNQAFSANPTTAQLIAGTAGVAALSELAPNDEIWVKY
jgi:hypothetical protein